MKFTFGNDWRFAADMGCDMYPWLAAESYNSKGYVIGRIIHNIYPNAGLPGAIKYMLIYHINFYD